MDILLTGASGLVGSALLPRLLAQGHTVHALCRRPPANIAAIGQLHWHAVDMATLLNEDDWLPLLDGIDLVINTVGIFAETGSQTYAHLHTQAPIALFNAAIVAGVERVIQLSALGAHPQAGTAYWRSKAAADTVLRTAPLDWAIVQPSLVYTDQGASSTLFRQMAAQPCLLVPADAGPVQPIHLADLVDALLQLIHRPALGRITLAAVGPQALPWHGYLQALRAGMGMARAPVIAIPTSWVGGLSRLAALCLGSLLSPASLSMLRAGSCADASPIQQLLGRPMRPPQAYSHPALRSAAVMAAWQPWLRLALALVWLLTAVVSIQQAPLGLQLLADAGLPTAWHTAALWGGAGLDLLLGVLTLSHPQRRLWQAQIALILGYTVFISLFLPQWWLHPFGPISKNLPILALLGLLAALAPANPKAS